MPAKHHIDTNSRLLITTWKGDAIDIDFIEALKKYQQDVKSNTDYRDFNEIVDLRKISRIKLTTDGIKKMCSIATATDLIGIDTKLALIVSSNFAFSLARLYVLYRSLSKYSNKTIRIFKTESDALEWINKK